MVFFVFFFFFFMFPKAVSVSRSYERPFLEDWYTMINGEENFSEFKFLFWAQLCCGWIMNLVCYMLGKSFLEKIMIKIGLNMISMDDLMILKRRIISDFRS